jgi:phage shock protein E
LDIKPDTIDFHAWTAFWAICLLLVTVGIGLAGCRVPADSTALQPTTTATPSKTASTATPAASGSVVRLITPAEAKAMLESLPNALLLDVRTAEEYAEGHISGSQLLPYDEIKSRASELPVDRNTPIIVYCRSGNRSAIAARTLAELGFNNIYDLGGIKDWPYETVK